MSESSKSESKSESKSKEQKQGATEAAGSSIGELPSIDFSTFVLSLSTSALYQLGLVNGPDGAPAPAPDLIMASQTIDTLKMLRSKTRGNLDEAELKLIDNLLYELHTHFVALSPDHS
ncbi:MAG: DUF1844 domain-containing protein [Deltaproteobacteria bacterium]|nr:DUF1844 domain-containing protein [Deltaproteobacteria bacterium]MBW2388858.1 DUF1844 domain-containing protein [Deltaproteobacteria bacterium]